MTQVCQHGYTFRMPIPAYGLPRHGEPMFPKRDEDTRESRAMVDDAESDEVEEDLAVEDPEDESPESSAAAATTSEAPNPFAPLIDEMRADRASTRQIVDRLMQEREPRPQVPQHPGPMPKDGDPEKYEQWLEARDRYRDHQTEERIMRQVGPQLQQTRDTSTLASLWNEIQQDPETAELAREEADTFEMAYAAEGGQLPADGDLQAFKRRIVSRVRKVVDRHNARAARAADVVDEDDAAPEERRQPARRAAAPAARTTPARAGAPASRTGGLSGASRQRRPAQKDKFDDPSRGILDDLAEAQAAMPYF